MRIQVEYKNLDSTPVMEEFIQEQLGKLEKLVEKYDLEGGVLARVELARTTHHHHKGLVYQATVNLNLPGTILRAEDLDFDPRVAIDRVRDKLKREIVKYKEINN